MARTARIPQHSLGVITDIDQTVIPKYANGRPVPAPFEGITELLNALENRDGVEGDTYYVTARTPERIAELEGYFAEHGLPEGPIDTGTSPKPWIAQAEKISDISRILEAHPDQRFVLLGDTAHRDPEVYRAIRERFPDQVVDVFIHKVNRTVKPERVEGMNVFENYSEVDAALRQLGVL